MNGNTPLHLAVLQDNIEPFKIVLNTCNIELKLQQVNDDGFTVLHIAVRQKRLEFVRELIEKDKNQMAVASMTDGNNALHMAILQEDSLPLIELMLETEVPKEVFTGRNGAGLTPLLLAQKTSTPIWQILLAYIEKNFIKRMENGGESNAKEIELSMMLLNSAAAASAPVTDDSDDNHEFSPDENICTAIDRELLKKALLNPVQFHKLCEILNADDLWKRVAQSIEFDEFYITRSQGFLYWLRRNIDTVDLEKFSHALLEYAKEAYHLIVRQ